MGELIHEVLEAVEKRYENAGAVSRGAIEEALIELRQDLIDEVIIVLEDKGYTILG